MADPITYSDDWGKMIAELFGKGKTSGGKTSQKTIDQLINEVNNSMTNATNNTTATNNSSQTGTSSVVSTADTDPLRQIFEQQAATGTVAGMSDLIQEVFRVGSQQVPGLTQAYANATGTRATDNSGYAMALGDLNRTLAGQAATLIGQQQANAANTASSIAAATKGSNTTSDQTTTGTSNSNTTGVSNTTGSKGTTGSTVEKGNEASTSTANNGYGATAATLLPELIAALGKGGATSGLAGLLGNAGNALGGLGSTISDLLGGGSTDWGTGADFGNLDLGSFFADGGMVGAPGYANGGVASAGGTRRNNADDFNSMPQPLSVEPPLPAGEVYRAPAQNMAASPQQQLVNLLPVPAGASSAQQAQINYDNGFAVGNMRGPMNQGAGVPNQGIPQSTVSMGPNGVQRSNNQAVLDFDRGIAAANPGVYRTNPGVVTTAPVGRGYADGGSPFEVTQANIPGLVSQMQAPQQPQLGGTAELSKLLMEALASKTGDTAGTTGEASGQTAGNSSRSGTPTENAAVVNGMLGSMMGIVGGPIGAAAAKGLGLGTMQGVIGTAAVNAAMASMGIGTIGGVTNAAAMDDAMAAEAMASLGDGYGGVSGMGGADFGATSGDPSADFGGLGDYGGGDSSSGDGASGGSASAGGGGGNEGGSDFGDGSAFADGGMVKGPGTGISDSISAQLVDHFGKKKDKIAVSDDEYILSADVTAMLGRDFLDSLQAKFHVPANVQRAQGVR